LWFIIPSASAQILHETQRLQASDGGAPDEFGHSVSISGDVAVVGAHFDDDNGNLSGSAYVFRWIPGVPGTWVQEQKLLPLDGAPVDEFGGSVSVSGEVIVVGARGGDDNAPNSGSAYVFRWNGASWIQEQKLLASDGQQMDWFGFSVTVSGDLALVGALFDESAYIFRWNGSSWEQEQKLEPSDGPGDRDFGASVSLSSSVAVVGARRADDNGADSGSAYVYRWDGANWVEEQKLLASDGSVGNGFGWDVSVEGDVIVAGARYERAAYVFGWNGVSWEQEQKLLPIGGAGDFGFRVSLSGDVVVVGAISYTGNGTDSGSAYVFRWNGGSWVQSQQMLPSDPGIGHLFGYSVSVSGDLVVVGAPVHETAYVFDLSCDDIVYCTEDTLNIEKGECVHQPNDAACSDGVGCNGAEYCDVQLGCMPGTPPNCDDGLFCNGIESCDNCNLLECCQCCFQKLGICLWGVDAIQCFLQGGMPECFDYRCLGQPPCDDGVACTVDTCDEAQRSCESTPNNLFCEDGVFCNGTEACDPADGCQAGTPIDCDDGVACTVDACDQMTDVCTSNAYDSLCDDGLYCNGLEYCDPELGCQVTIIVDCDDGIGCTIDTCDEPSDACSNTYEASICGSCCLQIGECIDGLTAEECATASGAFGQGTVCQGVAACCLPDESCIDVDVTCCQAQGGIPESAGLLCNDEDFFGCVVPIPTVSAWGLIVLTLLTLTGAKLAFRSRKSEST